MPNHFKALFYSATNADSWSVEVTLTDLLELSFSVDGVCYSHSLKHCNISSKLGSTPRHIRFEDGTQLESTDNKSVDHLVHLKNKGKANFLLNRLESKIGLMIPLSILLVVLIIGALKFAIPATAEMAAPLVPEKVRQTLSERVLLAIDYPDSVASQISLEEQTRISQLISDSILLNINQNIQFKFIELDGLGANAFALPDGTIVFSDELISLLTDDEIIAIAAHELGHVVEDHGIRSMLSASFVALSLSVFLGDSSAISEILISAPYVLTQLSYSRNLELEADQFAKDILINSNLKPASFITALDKLISAQETDETDESNFINTYFTTHPKPKDRFQFFSQ